MIVKGTTDFIRLFMLKNHIEYLDSDGWNEIFYHELDEDQREVAMDLDPIFHYLLKYVADPIIRSYKKQGKVVEHVVYFGTNMDTEELYMVLLMDDETQETVVLA